VATQTKGYGLGVDLWEWRIFQHTQKARVEAARGSVRFASVTNTEDDPILARRAQLGTAADLGKRLGYSLFGIAMVAFFVGLFTNFNDAWGWIVMGSLIAGSVLLLPAIIIGYAVKAAYRDDLGLDSGH
jgi:hypothetical protein